MELLGGEQGKALRQIEAELSAEHGKGAGAGPVSAGGTLRRDVREEVEIVAHGSAYERVAGPRQARSAAGAVVGVRVAGRAADSSISELASERTGDRQYVRDASDALALLAPALRARVTECLCVAHLDPARRLLAVSSHEGSRADLLELPVRAIIADALGLGATALVLAHNHPSGDARPSASDLASTQALAAVTRPLGISVFDHLIVTRAGFTSLRALGLL